MCEPSNSPPPAPLNRKSLLVADGCFLIHKLIFRLFEGTFDSILPAATATEAEMFLRNYNVSHIVISARIAEGMSTTDLVDRWRAQYPTIQRVVLYTGAEISSTELGSSIDAVVTKPCHCQSLINAVTGEFPD